MRCALIVGALYTLVHLLSTLLQTDPVFDGHDAGHVLLHTLDVWVIYMAIEPYVRRVWPRMLIGAVRLLSGRLADPAVGREVLIGVVTGCALIAALALASSAEWLSNTGGTGHLPSPGEVWSRLSPVQFLCGKVHRAAWTLLDTVRIAGLLIAIRLLVRHTLAALGLGIAVLGLAAYVWFMWMFGSGDVPTWLAIAYATGFGVAMVLLYTKVGALAALVAIFVLVPHRLLGTDLDAWFTPYGMAELAIPLALAAYGFWVSLAGQALFKDAMLDDKPARA